MKRSLGGWLWSDVDGNDDEYEYRYLRGEWKASIGSCRVLQRSHHIKNEETVKVVVTMPLSIPPHHSAPCIQFIIRCTVCTLFHTPLSSVKDFDEL